MHRIKIPQHDFALKMQGGLFAGHYGNTKYYYLFQNHYPVG